MAYFSLRVKGGHGGYGPVSRRCQKGDATQTHQYAYMVPVGERPPPPMVSPPLGGPLADRGMTLEALALTGTHQRAHRGGRGLLQDGQNLQNQRGAHAGVRLEALALTGTHQRAHRGGRGLFLQDDQNLQNQRATGAAHTGVRLEALALTGTHQRAHRGGGEAFCKMTITCKPSGPTGGGGGGALFKATMTMAGEWGGCQTSTIYIYIYVYKFPAKGQVLRTNFLFEGI